jgi:hypothetical protein
MGGVEAAGLDPVLREPGADGLDGLLGARDHAQRRRVDGGQREPTVQQVQRLLLRQGDGQHGALRQLLHQPPADGDQRQGVLQGEDAGQASGHVLAEAVPEHRLRPHAPLHPETRQRVLDGEEGRLGETGLLEEPARAFPRESAPQVEPAQVRREDLQAGVESLPVHRLALVQPASHAGVLRSLTGKKEDDGPPAGICDP